jgi:hypothetical protein
MIQWPETGVLPRHTISCTLADLEEQLSRLVLLDRRVCFQEHIFRLYPATPRYKLAVKLADQVKSNTAEETDGTCCERFE